MFERLRATFRLNGMLKRWVDATSIDPGDKGQVHRKAMQYMANLGHNADTAWVFAMMNWMLEMPWADSKAMLARGMVAFLGANEGEISVDREVLEAARQACSQIIEPRSGGSTSKEDLIRAMAKKRVRSDAAATRLGYDESMVDSLGTMQLMGIPEAAIATIVETYALSLKSGASENAILKHIEKHRSQFGSGHLPSPLNLESYIRYRIGIEHQHGSPIDSAFISEAIDTCRRHYGI
jgi:ribosomal protein L16/L10AE